jgi:hypothetical protein
MKHTGKLSSKGNKSMKHACKLSSGRVMGRSPFFVTCDYSRKPKPAHCNIWVNMLQGYCGILDPSIDNINSQPHVSMNLVKSRLDENWEYVKYELSFLEFKAQVNVDLKNKRHALKLLIESGSWNAWWLCTRTLGDHKMPYCLGGKTRQGSWNRAMQALVTTPSHSGHGGEVWGPLGVDSNRHPENRGWTPRYHNMK